MLPAVAFVAALVAGGFVVGIPPQGVQSVLNGRQLLPLRHLGCLGWHLGCFLDPCFVVFMQLFAQLFEQLLELYPPRLQLTLEVALSASASTPLWEMSAFVALVIKTLFLGCVHLEVG